MIRIGLLGLGTVGQGVFEIVNERFLKTSNKEPIIITKVLVRDKSKKRSLQISDDLITENFDDIVNDKDIDIVVSVMGGMEPELTYIKRSLKAGKHVVTANKEIISRHIVDLLDLAKNNKVSLMFEAAVGGGIPIISSIIQILKTNKINRIQGILNGTTNYILTKITREKRQFDDVLKEAQKIGFAEADPTADIDGYDIMRKICILSSIAFKTVIDENNVHMRGIGNVTYEDIENAGKHGYIIKYLAQGLLHDDNKYSVSVTPILIKKASVISNVNEENNIILIQGDIIGEMCFIGKGAGKNATANAVVSDVLQVAAGINDYALLRFDSNALSCGIDGIQNEYYIRVSTENFDQFAKSIDIVYESVKKLKLSYSKGKIFFITEKIASSEMKNLYTKLTQCAHDVFYARMENNLM